MNINLLKGCIRTCGMTQADLANELGISYSRLNAKINGTNGAEFTLGEAKELKRILNLSSAQIDSIFLE